MKHNFHEFRKNDKLKLQNYFVFIDTESETTQISKDKEILKFKMGCGIFWNRKDDTTFENTYYNVSDFWDDLESFFFNGCKNIILFAHNTQFDFKMLNGFSQLLKRDWKLTNHYVKSKVFMMTFQKRISKRIVFTLNVWDTMNYVPKSLKQLGESIGLPKLEVEFDNVSDKELEVYCKRDTEILYQFIRKLVEFLRVNNLTKLRATAGSLAFNTFRHRFYNPDDKKDKIYIHDWKKAINLERSSYKGGITDCFKIGSYNDLHKLDINSMYPYLMRNKALPSKLLFYSHENNYNQEQLFKIYSESVKKGYGCIIKATINLDSDNAYILSRFKKNKCMFGYGTFEATLCQPEIDFILEHGKVLHIHEISVYYLKILFKEYVDFFYNVKKTAKKENNKVDEAFSKIMLNTLYGKWGQKQIDYRELKIDDKFMIDYQEVIKLMLLKLFKNNPKFNKYNDIAYLGKILTEGELYIISGKLYLLKQTESNSKESFVAIASFITSYARMLLIDYVKTAKRDNVYYCDTDSLMVNQQGYDNLKTHQYIDEYDLGKLKSEGYGIGTFYAPKFYDFDNERKAKGIKKSGSVLIFEDNYKAVYEVHLWEKFKTHLKKGFTDEQLIITTTKELKKKYDKGKILENGVVFPYSVKEIYS